MGFLKSYTAHLVGCIGASAMSAAAMVYGLISGKAPPQWAGFVCCILFQVGTTFRVRREELKRRKAVELERDRDRQEFIDSSDKLKAQCERDLSVMRTAHESEAVELRYRLSQSDSRIGRPALGLCFSEAKQRDPVAEGMTIRHFDRESELLIRNGSDRDAYDVRVLSARIGDYTIHSRIPVNIPSQSERRVDYSGVFRRRGYNARIFYVPA